MVVHNEACSFYTNVCLYTAITGTVGTSLAKNANILVPPYSLINSHPNLCHFVNKRYHNQSFIKCLQNATVTNILKQINAISQCRLRVQWFHEVHS